MLENQSLDLKRAFFYVAIGFPFVTIIINLIIDFRFSIDLIGNLGVPEISSLFLLGVIQGVIFGLLWVGVIGFSIKIVSDKYNLGKKSIIFGCFILNLIIVLLLFLMIWIVTQGNFVNSEYSIFGLVFTSVIVSLLGGFGLTKNINKK